jgi:hypothetical protein
MMLALACLATVLTVSPPATATARLALVVGYNQSSDAALQPLRFADDDAIATDALLREAGAETVLLVRPDEDTRREHPTLEAGPPTPAGLTKAFADLAVRAEALIATGQRAELYFFYSGHGGVADDEGYVELDGGRLTRRDLQAFLSRSHAMRNHVFVDACRSYYLAFARGAGGERGTFEGRVVSGRPGALANTGFALSTSSERDSHEWTRFGAGIFSHELRSALRGAADADGDGRISYAELGAFLAKNNEAIANPRFRPDFLVRPPGGTAADLDETVLAWPEAAGSTLLVDTPFGHLYVESAAGARVLDAHARPDQPQRLRLPRSRPLFVRAGPAEYVLSTLDSERLSRLVAARGASPQEKGALNLAFETLFSQPFGTDDVATYGDHYALEVREQVAREERATGLWRRRLAGSVCLGTGTSAVVMGAGLLGWAWQRYSAGDGQSQAERQRLNGDIRRFNRLGTILIGVGAGVALAGWLLRTVGQDSTALATVGAIAPMPDRRGVGLAVRALW